MSKDKSILERFTDTVKDIANSASEALKADEPPKVEQSNAAYMPFVAEGLVSDPLLIPPVVARPRRTRAVKKTAKKTSARGKAKARRAAKASAKRTTKRAAKRKSAKRSVGRGRR